MNCSLFILLVAALLLSVNAQSREYYSASCLAKRTGCGRWIAQRSRGCKANAMAMYQTQSCKNAGCGWCRGGGNRKSQFPCNTVGIHRACKVPGSPPNPPSNTRPPTPPKSCTWRPNSSGKAIVISMGDIPPMHGWTRISRNGMNGLVYRRNLGGGIDRAGSKGSYCFPITASMNGHYQLTTVSYAPHNTEHNDMWIRSPTLGFQLWMNGRYFTTSYNWLKAYQNDGRSRMSSVIYHKDWDPHRFMLKNVQAGKTFNICISGRSYRFELYKIIIKKCSGRECGGGSMNNAMQMSNSQCK